MKRHYRYDYQTSQWGVVIGNVWEYIEALGYAAFLGQQHERMSMGGWIVGDNRTFERRTSFEPHIQWYH